MMDPACSWLSSRQTSTGSQAMEETLHYRLAPDISFSGFSGLATQSDWLDNDRLILLGPRGCLYPVFTMSDELLYTW